MNCCGNCAHVYNPACGIMCLNKKSVFYDKQIVSYGCCLDHKPKKMDLSVRMEANAERALDGIVCIQEVTREE